MKKSSIGGDNMTIQDLYEWAIKHNAANLDIEIQYRDSGGYYSGTTNLEPCHIEIEHRSAGDVVVL